MGWDLDLNDAALAYETSSQLLKTVNCCPSFDYTYLVYYIKKSTLQL